MKGKTKLMLELMPIRNNNNSNSNKKVFLCCKERYFQCKPIRGFLYCGPKTQEPCDPILWIEVRWAWALLMQIPCNARQIHHKFIRPNGIDSPIAIPHWIPLHHFQEFRSFCCCCCCCSFILYFEYESIRNHALNIEYVVDDVVWVFVLRFRFEATDH